MTDQIFASLNPQQQEAASHTEGPLLILAGAGTGKTKVLTTRVAHLLFSGAANPNQIMAVTFTNKAAAEMKERISHLIGQAPDGMWLGTFHSLCVRMLRMHPETVGLDRFFTIIDTDDQTRLCKQLIADHHIDEKKWPARMLVNIISRWKDNAWLPEQLPEKECKSFNGFGKMLYVKYQHQLEINNAVDFGDIILKTLIMLKENSDLLEKFQAWFKYVLVDEYQDTNNVQYMLIRLLTMGHKNLCVVGDDDQSIYGWRGAEVGNILRFEKDFPGCKVVRLEQNYRSTGHILKAAAGVIAHNTERHDKTLWTEGADGNLVEVHHVRDGWEEGRLISDRIEAEIRGGKSYNDMAVLLRSAAQTRMVEERLKNLAIPYEIVGGLRFYERKEVRDAIAYLRLIISENDGLAFQRVVNVPRRGIGESAMNVLREIAVGDEVPIIEAARIAVAEKRISRGRTGLEEFLNVLHTLKAKKDERTPDRFMELVLEDSGYMDMLDADKNKEEARARKDNLKELLRAMQEYASIEDFLEHVALVTDVSEENGDTVKITTVHAAKGLEFDTVFIPGFEEGMFPHQRSINEGDVEEERRLAYVAMTRARRQLVISHAERRFMYGDEQPCSPSRFLDEMPKDSIKEEQGMGGGYSWRPNAGSGFEKNGGKFSQPMFYNKKKEDFVPDVKAIAIEGDYPVGTRVFHQKFGYGRVKRQSGTGDSQRITIGFDKAGEKTLLAGLAKLEKA